MTFSFFFICFSATFIMGQQSNFNAQLNDVTKRFTYFVPRDLAWQQVRTAIPSTFKVLFMPEYAAQVSSPF